jgi:hypothetical protein
MSTVVTDKVFNVVSDEDGRIVEVKLVNKENSIERARTTQNKPSQKKQSRSEATQQKTEIQIHRI